MRLPRRIRVEPRDDFVPLRMRRFLFCQEDYEMEWTEKRAAGQIVVTLPNGVPKELPRGATVEDLAGSIGRELKRSAIGAIFPIIHG